MLRVIFSIKDDKLRINIKIMQKWMSTSEVIASFVNSLDIGLTLLM